MYTTDCTRIVSMRFYFLFRMVLHGAEKASTVVDEKFMISPSQVEHTVNLQVWKELHAWCLIHLKLMDTPGFGQVEMVLICADARYCNRYIWQKMLEIHGCGTGSYENGVTDEMEADDNSKKTHVRGTRWVMFCTLPERFLYYLCINKTSDFKKSSSTGFNVEPSFMMYKYIICIRISITFRVWLKCRKY